MGAVLTATVPVKLGLEDVKLIAMSGVELVVEGAVPLRLGIERSVEVSGDNFGPRLRGRVVECEVVGLGGGGACYRIVLVLNRPIDLTPPPSSNPFLSSLEVGNVELGDPDPALAANSW